MKSENRFFSYTFCVFFFLLRDFLLPLIENRWKAIAPESEKREREKESWKERKKKYFACCREQYTPYQHSLCYFFFENLLTFCFMLCHFQAAALAFSRRLVKKDEGVGESEGKRSLS